ncbi:hypothetical protein FACS189472_04860 [Alphaproteobacteria bacterium]|nr:hypothetical protein FACS189472_04860 [Alphaproteobacteria bacterium]
MKIPTEYTHVITFEIASGTCALFTTSYNNGGYEKFLYGICNAHSIGAAWIDPPSWEHLGFQPLFDAQVEGSLTFKQVSEAKMETPVELKFRELCSWLRRGRARCSEFYQGKDGEHWKIHSYVLTGYCFRLPIDALRNFWIKHQGAMGIPYLAQKESQWHLRTEINRRHWKAH